ncbi:zf-HC2 domain-containing protein [Streptomyces sp. NPDC005407]|uniref:anti-sigma factor family protein n=1 Tax=Streptomyces sp. NPDC005407 TaxID=3155340 RepID=UPI0033B7634D
MRVELAAYSLGGLDPADRETVEVHLADCPECREERGSYVGLVGLMGTGQEREVFDVPSVDSGLE